MGGLSRAGGGKVAVELNPWPMAVLRRKTLTRCGLAHDGHDVC